MPQCPICGNDYAENINPTCLTCGWDLTRYPSSLKGLIEERESRLTWARKVWESRQLCVEEIEKSKTKPQELELSYTYAGSTLTIHFPDGICFENNKPLGIISCRENEIKILMDEYARQFEWLTKEQRQTYMSYLENTETLSTF